MRGAIPALSLIGMLIAAPAAFVQDTYDSPSGAVRIVGGSGEQKSVAVGDQAIPLGDYYAGLHEKVGNLVLVLSLADEQPARRSSLGSSRHPEKCR